MRQTARSAGSVAVLALLVGACVPGAMTGPAVSLRTRTQVMSQTLAAASPIIKTVQVDAPWDQFTNSINVRVALGTSDRALTLARLTVMGHERATRLVLLEALPAVVVAVAAGAACALALPPLVGSALDLSVFTGPGVPVMVRPDWISLGLLAVTALLLAAAALASEARRLSRRGVARMLRAE
jgi:hypothetical protein